MKQHLENIRLAGNQGVAEATVIQARTLVRISELPVRTKSAITTSVMGFVFLLNSGIAWAAAECGGGGAAKTLTSFIDSAATFMIALGGAGALLMFAIGACFIIFGGQSSRVRRGMEMIKNAVIGLIILAIGAFIKFVVLEFLSGATAGESESGGCIQGKLA